MSAGIHSSVVEKQLQELVDTFEANVAQVRLDDGEISLPDRNGGPPHS